ncbi:AAR2-domain-containing protein [Coemansia reversa NRRL 1564]|uniref:AAR2-domain-containing protein n=1 Tax=Coemansia reversa (strain ATCC 12441 / NRRL 1564) TaxID=763665 RepID=A0A2G5B961_COERN|nr:AAR2-domain-containing protein [Coemansia reversa NRRL 1564]|eukprot:PIA15555.1 AAR2-domain-containing protein [Coemansia reversa NRRL 1564]
MDPDTARARFENGAFFVMLDAPAGLEFGIDLDTWETGPLFKGLKMIPPGIHYIHYSVVNGDKQPGMRSGFFYNFNSREVVVRKWSKENEELLSPDFVRKEDVESVQLNIRDLDTGLGAYQLGEIREDNGRLPAYTRWQLLTEHITPKLLHRILPPYGCFSSATGSVYEDEEIASVRRMLERNAHSMADQGISVADARAIIDSEAAANKGVESDDRFHFTHINIRHSFPKDAKPEEIRLFSQDKSWLLRHILKQHGVYELLGEFELSFLVILVGQNFTGIEHWKRILHLVLGSIQILEDREIVETLFVPILRILLCQLGECPHEFVASVLEQDNFVAEILRSLVLNVYECKNLSVKQLLDSEIENLRLLLAGFGWSLPKGNQLQEEADMEEGEYAPQVVEL